MVSGHPVKKDLEAAPVLAIYARTPEPGRVKTRLHPLLGPSGAAFLYQAFLMDTLEGTASFPGDRYLVVDGDPEMPWFQELARRHRLCLQRQEAGNLGTRMAATIQAFLKAGRPAVLLLGSDSPTVPGDWIADAATQLVRKTWEVVLGPSLDGGYYLLGVNRWIPALFQEIPWSTSRVLRLTLERLEALGVAYSLLPFWYDVDTPEDLHWLQSHLRYLSRLDPSRGRHTRERLSRLLP